MEKPKYLGEGTYWQEFKKTKHLNRKFFLPLLGNELKNVYKNILILKN